MAAEYVENYYENGVWEVECGNLSAAAALSKFRGKHHNDLKIIAISHRFFENWEFWTILTDDKREL